MCSQPFWGVSRRKRSCYSLSRSSLQNTGQIAKVLYVTAQKDPIKFIIGGILVGEVNSNGNDSIPFPDNDVHQLLSLNQLLAFLKIDFLEKRYQANRWHYPQRATIIRADGSIFLVCRNSLPDSQSPET